MHETQEIVINTGPILALIAGLGDLRVLQMYERVLVPWEVSQEILVENGTRFGAKAFQEAHWLSKFTTPTAIPPFLANTLDKGEAAVIQTALDHQIPTVCIDEVAGRRIARLNGLHVTGSMGILLRAKREGHIASIRTVIERMRTQGIWLSDRVVQFVLQQSGEL